MQRAVLIGKKMVYHKVVVLPAAQAHSARNRQVFYANAMLDIVNANGGCIELPQA